MSSLNVVMKETKRKKYLHTRAVGTNSLIKLGVQKNNHIKIVSSFQGLIPFVPIYPLKKTQLDCITELQIADVKTILHYSDNILHVSSIMEKNVFAYSHPPCLFEGWACLYCISCFARTVRARVQLVG